MTIKEVSEKYNIPQDTLRYYERVGVIPAVQRTKSGIRCYNEQDRLQMTLRECCDFLKAESINNYKADKIFTHICH